MLNISLVLLSVFDGLSLQNRSAESCAYDTVNAQWIFVDQESNQIDTLTGLYPGTRTTLEPTDLMATDTSFDGLSLGTLFVAAADSPSEKNLLFIANAVPSEILVYDVDADALIASQTVDLSAFGPVGTNGLCYDPDNDVLYATNIGIDLTSTSGPAYMDSLSSIVAIEGISGENPQTVRISVENPMDQDGRNVTGKTYRPNGCSFARGKAWFVESPIEGGGSLGIYDPETQQFSINTDILDYDAGGLIAVGDYLVLSSVGDRADAAGGGFLAYYDLNEYPDGKFQVGLRRLMIPGDIAYDPETNIVCVPELGNGDVTFVQFAEPITSTETVDTTSTTNEDADASGAFRAGVVMSTIA
eukprot:CAMPEP_0197050880 /NCGR_PEP_ID=MMETSP1384-20130603/25682_1 /TAXON_ID=29189 /ORGANISM="Ammonia sp." /LENGTH=357 /DNA_ID=CAMNT_0042483357 /DNA_START=136 /DNA_END=1205 /DNA_ORIENTATION=-